MKMSKREMKWFSLALAFRNRALPGAARPILNGPLSGGSLDLEQIVLLS